MANHSGRPASEARIRASREAFDALPLPVKAAVWDAMQPWCGLWVSDHWRRHGTTATLAMLAEADAELIAQRKPWMRRNQMRVGQRREAMPPSPHQASNATQLRSHAHLYASR
jgi:hypothetical protein